MEQFSRYTNLTRLLRAAGHRVYYLVNDHQSDQRELRDQCLEGLRQQGCFDDSFQLERPGSSRADAGGRAIFR